jgi:predicted nucleotidyltransferase
MDWSVRLKSLVPAYLRESKALGPIADRCAVVLHGSTTLGIDDAFSDLDLWVIAPNETVRQAEEIAGTRFFSFVLDDKPGHFNLEPMEEMRSRLRRCDLELIAELRRAEIIADVENVAADLIASARRPMSGAVREAWFCYHYVEMRGFHRNCDTPIERGDAIALLQGLVPTLNHALRAAMVLDGMPYPYIKWLAQSAATTPTGRRMLPLVYDMLDLLAADALRQPGPEKNHPISLKLREIRRILIDSARAAGVDQPWLDRWWEHLTQARRGIAAVAW